MVYSPIDTKDRTEIRAIQANRLQETVERAYENVPFYREKLDDAGVSPDDIDGVEDITKLPMTTKEDFRDEYPDGLFAVEDDAIQRIHASSSGTRQAQDRLLHRGRPRRLERSRRPS